MNICKEMAPDKAAIIPIWLRKRLEFDMLIAMALLDSAVIDAQVLTADVASELRAFHTGALCQVYRHEMKNLNSITLPNLALLPVTNQLSPFASYLPSQTIQVKPQRDASNDDTQTLSPHAVVELVELAKTQPMLGHHICRFLSVNNEVMMERIQQICVGLTADALLTSTNANFWRHMQYFELSGKEEDIPWCAYELFSVLLICVYNPGLETVKTALEPKLRAMLRIATAPERLVRAKEPKFRDDDAQNAIASIFACTATLTQNARMQHKNLPREKEMEENKGKPPQGTNVRFSKFLVRMTRTSPDPEEEDAWQKKFDEQQMGVSAKSPEEHAVRAKATFVSRAKLYEAFLSHDAPHTGLRIFSLIEDKYLRFRARHLLLPPAYETFDVQVPSATVDHIEFWDQYFEFTRIAEVHCLEYVVKEACSFCKNLNFWAAACLLAPFPQLKPLVVLLSWPELGASGYELQSRQHLLDVLWKSYTETTKEDPRKVGDLLVDCWVEVLDYNLSVSWWIAELVMTHTKKTQREERHPPLTGDAASKTGEAKTSPENKLLATEHASQVLKRIAGGDSILLVMRPHLPLVESKTLISALESLPPLRQRARAMEHSYDTDITRCYYVVRCAMFLVDKCIDLQSRFPTPGKQFIEESINELNRLLSSIERTSLKISVFFHLASLCFVQHTHRVKNTADPAKVFLVPPPVLLSLLALLRRHIQLTLDMDVPSGRLVRLNNFTKEALWRLFMGLKDFFSFSQLVAMKDEDRPIVAKTGTWQHIWADSIGAVVIGTALEKLDDFTVSLQTNDPSMKDHPLLQFRTPPEVPSTLHPRTFLPHMLAHPTTLVYRALKLNDYDLASRLCAYFATSLDPCVEKTLVAAKTFRDMRHKLVDTPLDTLPTDELGQHLEELLSLPLSDVLVAKPPEQSTGQHLEESVHGPLNVFFFLVDLAVSAAPFSEISTVLLKRATIILDTSSVELALEPHTLAFFRNWIARLNVLVEARTEFRGHASLASIILGIETLPSEPALLKSHLNRLHSQRHAIMSLVESVDLVKKGQTSKVGEQKSLVDFLSSAMKQGTPADTDTKEISEAKVEDQFPEDSDVNPLVATSRYLLCFLEYLTKVADLMRSVTASANGRSTEEDTSAKKLFDVLAERPMSIIARLLFELGGSSQAEALAEVMGVDLIEVILNSSHSLDGSAHSADSFPHYPMSMQVINYLGEQRTPLPMVLSQDARLIASITCIERRPERWPSQRFLNYALKHTTQFPALNRWVEDRCHIWGATLFTGEGEDFAGSWDQDSDSELGAGHTVEEMELLSADKCLALEALANDNEAASAIAYRTVVDTLIEQERYEQAIEVCDEYLPFDCGQIVGKVLHLLLTGGGNVDSLKDHEYLYRLKDKQVAAEFALQRYTRWESLDTAIPTLTMCLQGDILDPTARSLEQVLKKLTTLYKVLDCYPEVRSWQEIDAAAARDNKVVERLLAHEQHDLAKTLSEMYPQEDEDEQHQQAVVGVAGERHDGKKEKKRTPFSLRLEFHRLHHLFTTNNDKTQAVSRLMTFPPSQAAEFAFQLLDGLDLINHRGLLCRFLLTKLTSWLTEEQVCYLRLLDASLQLLGTVSTTIESQFLPLLQSPLLIVETLLMNARVDLLAPFLLDFPQYRVDGLILRYARKALALASTPEQTRHASDGALSVAPQSPRGAGIGGVWCLTNNDEDDDKIRAAHGFEAAPSISLAVDVLELCSTNPANAEKCFSICNELSLRLYDLLPRFVDDVGSMSRIPLQSPRVVSHLIYGLLEYLIKKYQNTTDARGKKHAMDNCSATSHMFETSLSNLRELLPALWQRGYKVGLATLCAPDSARELRDRLIQDDHLELAQEVCERCGTQGAEEEYPWSWSLSDAPFRESKAVSYIKLQRFAEARDELHEGVSTKTLESLENAMRYPPLFDLESLEYMETLFSSNSLHRQLYRTTPTLAPLPLFHFPERNSRPNPGTMRRGGKVYQTQVKAPKRPTVPLAAKGVSEASPSVVEGNADTTKLTVPKLLNEEDVFMGYGIRLTETSGIPFGHEVQLYHAVAYLYPPVHPDTMPSWSQKPTQVQSEHDEVRRLHEEDNDDDSSAPTFSLKGTKECETPPPVVVEDSGEHHYLQQADKDLNRYLKCMVTKACAISAGCDVTKGNLRSQSNLWPADNHMQALMPASPLALPRALPCVRPQRQGRLDKRSCEEMQQYHTKYGTAHNLLSLLVREGQLTEACHFIFNNKIRAKLFVDVVATHCLEHNQFYDLQKVILNYDSSLRCVQDYLDPLKTYLRNLRALDLLYSYQVFTMDYVNAGLLAIQLFRDSKTWDARVGHLQNAYAHLATALARSKKDKEDGDDSGQYSSPERGAGGSLGRLIDVTNGQELSELDIRRKLDIVKLQLNVVEAAPTTMPHSLDLFSESPEACEVVEILLIQGHFGLAHTIIEFLDLPAVVLCVRASNEIATREARADDGQIARVVRFLEAVQKTTLESGRNDAREIEIQWDSLVSNVINIWIYERKDHLREESEAKVLLKFIQDDKSRLDALELLGLLSKGSNGRAYSYPPGEFP
eukprot:GEMP01000200.1.p1 GENE.GEMP01000200.1~~GEMP01000200.1.p1  ORF type:complete len:2672 (+),score=706.44 GEMP01000200.1:330-8018(+)